MSNDEPGADTGDFGIDEAIRELTELSRQPIGDETKQQLVADVLRFARKIEALHSQKMRAQLSGYLRDAVTPLTSGSDNLVTAQSARNELELQFKWRRSLVIRAVLLWGTGDPGHAIFGGMLAAVLLFFIVTPATILIVREGFHFQPFFEPWEMFPLLLAALFGVLASQITALQQPPPEMYDPGLIFMRAFFKPFLGMIFAVGVYAVLKAGIVEIEGFEIAVREYPPDTADASEAPSAPSTGALAQPDPAATTTPDAPPDQTAKTAPATTNGPSTDDPKGAQADRTDADERPGTRHPYILWVIGFLSGFSERFAPGIFDRVGGK